MKSPLESSQWPWGCYACMCVCVCGVCLTCPPCREQSTHPTWMFPCWAPGMIWTRSKSLPRITMSHPEAYACNRKHDETWGHHSHTHTHTHTGVYRERLVVDVAHRVAVFSGVDGACEHLVEVHVLGTRVSARTPGAKHTHTCLVSPSLHHTTTYIKPEISRADSRAEEPLTMSITLMFKPLFLLIIESFVINSSFTRHSRLNQFQF